MSCSSGDYFFRAKVEPELHFERNYILFSSTRVLIQKETLLLLLPKPCEV